MKTAIILVSVLMTGCATQSGWDRGTELLNKGPIVYQIPQQPNNGVADVRTGTTTYNLPSGSYQVNRVGNTVTAIQTSKTR